VQHFSEKHAPGLDPRDPCSNRRLGRDNDSKKIYPT
jgi:hypothetical protein